MSKYCDNCKNKWHCGDNCTCDESKAYEQGRADKAKEMIDKLYDMFAKNNGRIFLLDFDSFVKEQSE